MLEGKRSSIGIADILNCDIYLFIYLSSQYLRRIGIADLWSPSYASRIKSYECLGTSVLVVKTTEDNPNATIMTQRNIV
jgi:hypothetical protein